MSIRYWLCFAAITLPAGAQPLASLVEEALRNNREILAAQKKYEAARQRPSQAASLPDPSLSVGYSSNGGPWPVAGIGREPTSNAGVSISQELPAPGKRKLRGAIAQRDADAGFEAYRSVRLNVVERVEQAYHELHHANEAVASVKRSQTILQQILRIAEARYAAGRATQQEIFKSQTQYSILETQMVRYQQEQTSKQIEIRALLNRPAGGPAIDTVGEMAPGELPSTLEEMLAHARREGPVLAREQKLVERSELSANLARKDYLPDYTVSGGYFNQGSLPPMWQFRVDFRLPAYFWGKQRAAVNEQAFAASDARHSYEAAEVDLEARIREDYTLAETARKLIDLYEKSVIPEAQLALESSLAGYETGAGDFLAVFSNFLNVVDYDLAYHEEIMQFHVARARLNELTGKETE
jgi:outer membrane protein, heavy metal efflux system